MPHHQLPLACERNSIFNVNNIKSKIPEDYKNIWHHESYLAMIVLQVCIEVSGWFVGGCNVFLDKTLQGALTTLDDLETQAQVLTETRHDSQVCPWSCSELLTLLKRFDVTLFGLVQHFGSNWRSGIKILVSFKRALFVHERYVYMKSLVCVLICMSFIKYAWVCLLKACLCMKFLF